VCLSQAYITNLNKAMAGKPAASLVSLMPDAKKNKLNNAGGGHYNHCLFWTTMGPKAGGAPSGDLAKKMNEAFGSYDEFKTKFSAAAAGVFGARAYRTASAFSIRQSIHRAGPSLWLL
jgi:Fe-Mn family superoxide dismutase